ncbi:MAG TPA: hypothetical protein VL651_11765 [Bacteroidia bacterium]|jgi:hypothetical protein|nr:hypothetical protein [Bacteroidia bacterium]
MPELPSNIHSFLSHPDLLVELLPVAVELFGKDLDSSGIENNSLHAKDIYEFRDAALTVIRSNGGIASEKIMRLLYRVDVLQRKTEAVMSDSDPETALAEQMVIRELQKAWTRKLFR